MRRNRGSSYKFVLNELPFSQNEIFVDASSSWGIGGFLGDSYFSIPNGDLEIFSDLSRRYRTRGSSKDSPSHRLHISYVELLAAMIGIICFIPSCTFFLESCFITTYYDPITGCRASKAILQQIEQIYMV